MQEYPDELRNAYKDPINQDIIKKMKEELIKQRKLLGDTDQDNKEILEIISKRWDE